jgi:hypothetical protein
MLSINPISLQSETNRFSTPSSWASLNSRYPPPPTTEIFDPIKQFRNSSTRVDLVPSGVGNRCFLLTPSPIVSCKFKLLPSDVEHSLSPFTPPNRHNLFFSVGFETCGKILGRSHRHRCALPTQNRLLHAHKFSTSDVL